MGIAKHLCEKVRNMMQISGIPDQTPAIEQHLAGLRSEVQGEIQDFLRLIGRHHLTQSSAAVAGEALRKLGEVNDRVVELERQEKLVFHKLLVCLDAMGNRVVNWLAGHPEPLAQLPLIKALESLRSASLEPHLLDGTAVKAAVSGIVIPTELIRQLHRSLFPAERMLLVSGRRLADMVSVTAAFEVTGQHSVGHV